MNNRFLMGFLLVLSSCTSVKLPVSQEFSSNATKMHVNGLQGWLVNQQLNFGNYNTSKVKRGWDFAASVQYSKFRIRPEEALLKVFDINTNNNTNYQRNKFQYTIEEGNLLAEVYATEKFNEKQLVYKSNNPWLGEASKTHKYEYAFTAAILPLAPKIDEPWSMVLINKYDIKKDTAQKLFDKPYVEEEGYATNGKENIAIRPLRIDRVTNNDGQSTKIFGGKLLAGYELYKDNNVVGIVDILDNNIWLSDKLPSSEKLILSSISSAILLKRMQDVEKDKEHFSN